MQESHFFLPKDDTKLCEFITQIANSRSKDWKSNCRYETHGEKTRKEFIHRKEQWTKLVEHFKDPAQQVKCARMKQSQDKMMNHHSGKTPFSISQAPRKRT
ncbi:unnamed protein product [Rhodiola kirilowii]